MPQTPAQKALDEVIAGALTPALQPEGYRKRAHTFRRTRERSVQVVNVQTSHGSTAQVVRFTINLGVYHAAVGELGEMFFGAPRDPTSVKEYECHLRARIGALLPTRSDLWWALDTAKPIGPLVVEVDHAIRTYGMPWLASMSDLHVARREVREQGPLPIVLALAAGDRASASALVEGMQREGRASGALLHWARQQGLLEQY